MILETAACAASDPARIIKLRAKMVCDFRGASNIQSPAECLVFHSDRGSQYAARDYRRALKAANITCSMSRRGSCRDNPVAESFFSTLKIELIYRTILLSATSAKTTIAEWIEVFYNGKRRRSSIGYLSPHEYEHRCYADLIAMKVA